jgi:3-oxoadipate enol-lactonase
VDQTLALLASNPNPQYADAYARQASAYLQHDVLDRLSAVRAPTLVIGGEQDLLTPPWIVEEVASAIPRAQFKLLRGDGSSHLLPLERAAEFNQLVEDFLSDAVGTPQVDPVPVRNMQTAPV